SCSSSHVCSCSAPHLSFYSGLFLLYCSRLLRDLHSFPTRRSSDLRFTERCMSAKGYRGLGETLKFSEAPSMNIGSSAISIRWARSEEHTSELQSHLNLVCRLLLEKKTTPRHTRPTTQNRRLRHRNP